MQMTKRYTQDDIWDDTPDMDAIDNLKYTAYYRQIKGTLDNINKAQARQKDLKNHKTGGEA